MTGNPSSPTAVGRDEQLSQWSVPKMWPAGKTEFPKCRGGGANCIHVVLGFQKPRGARAHLGVGKALTLTYAALPF